MNREQPEYIESFTAADYLRGLSLVCVFVIIRFLLIVKSSLSGDEATFGLMALAIGKGEEYPLYCWGAHYASALISYIAVPFFMLLGVSAFSLKTAVLIFGMTLTPLIYFSMRRQHDEVVATLAALTFAVPLPVILEYSIAANGGHGETYLLGFAIWIVALGILRAPSISLFALFGFLCGASFSILWLGIPFIVSALVVLIREKAFDKKSSVASSLAALAGMAPFLYYNLVAAPAATLLRLGARSLEVRSGAGAFDGLVNRIAGLPRWIGESAIGLGDVFSGRFGIAIAVLFIAALLLGARNLVKRRDPRGMLVISFIAALIIFNCAGNLVRARHWCTLLFALIPAWAGFSRRTHIALLSVFLLFGVTQSAMRLGYQQLDHRISTAAGAVAESGADALIADYDLGYPIAFELKGAVPLSAIAPPNPGDRRLDWTRRIESARRPAVLLPVASLNAFIAAGRPHDVAVRYIDDRVLLFPSSSGAEAIEKVRALGAVENAQKR